MSRAPREAEPSSEEFTAVEPHVTTGWPQRAGSSAAGTEAKASAVMHRAGPQAACSRHLLPSDLRRACEDDPVCFTPKNVVLREGKWLAQRPRWGCCGAASLLRGGVGEPSLHVGRWVQPLVETSALHEHLAWV